MKAEPRSISKKRKILLHSIQTFWSLFIQFHVSSGYVSGLFYYALLISFTFCFSSSHLYVCLFFHLLLDGPFSIRLTISLYPFLWTLFSYFLRPLVFSSFSCARITYHLCLFIFFFSFYMFHFFPQSISMKRTSFDYYCTHLTLRYQLIMSSKVQKIGLINFSPSVYLSGTYS